LQSFYRLQNRIVDSRFRDSDYRRTRNYVGETIARQKEKTHFACPKPEDQADPMEGLVIAHKRMDAGNAPAVIHAATIVLPENRPLYSLLSSK